MPDKLCCLQHSWKHRTGSSKGMLGLFGRHIVGERGKKKRFKKIPVETEDRKYIPVSSNKLARL